MSGTLNHRWPSFDQATIRTISAINWIKGENRCGNSARRNAGLIRNNSALKRREHLSYRAGDLECRDPGHENAGHSGRRCGHTTAEHPRAQCYVPMTGHRQGGRRGLHACAESGSPYDLYVSTQQFYVVIAVSEAIIPESHRIFPPSEIARRKGEMAR